jgi:hypothetical protein
MYNKEFSKWGRFINIGAIGTITNALFFMFSCQKNINITHFFYTFDDNVLNILWKHV